METLTPQQQAAILLGSRGGSAGKGECKRRGDSAYYKSIRMRREIKKDLARAEATLKR
jgi:hypothetical protein